MREQMLREVVGECLPAPPWTPLTPLWTLITAPPPLSCGPSLSLQFDRWMLEELGHRARAALPHLSASSRMLFNPVGVGWERRGLQPVCPLCCGPCLRRCLCICPITNDLPVTTPF